MLVKAGIAAVALIGAVVSLISLDFREIYNEMYPVNGLRRDVLGLCRVAKPAYIRAVRSDRENCYDSMPDSVEKAIGWVRTSRLAAMRQPPTAIELAERLLANADAQRRFGIGGPIQFTGYLAMQAVGVRRCTDAASDLAPVDAMADLRLRLTPGLPPGLPSERLARQIVGGDDAVLAALGLGELGLGELGLAPRGVRPAPPREQLLPILRLSDSGPGGAETTGIADAASALFAPLPVADLGASRLGASRLGASRLGDGGASPFAPAAGCRIPA